ncbi:hypothetical protein PISL3812_02123 [Talaromyces islandicus]|uniref:Uncharacterized protein n=1 Tax=Talaromyces islandicus TaxID=28573 RepID=A0A0U1LRF0_TALIS|nr:hypothetical protein PISL3812_02123 [Talaromyces islandicus]
MGNHQAGSNESEQFPGKRKNDGTIEHTEPLPKDHEHGVDMRLQNTELHTAVQSWILNELGLALYQLYHEFQHLMPSMQPLQMYRQMQTLLDSLEAAVPNRPLCDKMRERAEHVLAQRGLDQFGFDVQPPPFYDATVKASQLRREDVQTVPEQLCSIEIHSQERSQPVVRLPRPACPGNEKHLFGENGPRMAITETPGSECQPVNGVWSGMPQEAECCVDTCSTQQGECNGRDE